MIYDMGKHILAERMVINLKDDKTTAGVKHPDTFVNDRLLLRE